jgi:hypothetical protein
MYFLTDTRTLVKLNEKAIGIKELGQVFDEKKYENCEIATRNSIETV